ncbi:MAG: LysR family transcriptional regulator [Pseudomonadota bacterium]
MIRLPSFADLLAFDAAARHGALTRAAQELNVTQPAISRRIAQLEADIGCRLLDRSVRPIALTPEGQQLFDVLRGSLSRLETVVERLREQEESAAIEISAAPGIAAYWLVPRLNAMQSAFPDTKINVISQPYSAARRAGDIQIRFGDGEWPGLNVWSIIGETVFPVASPLLFQDRAPPSDIAGITQLTLLSLPPRAGSWYDWPAWLRSVGGAPGAAASRRLRAMVFDNYVLVVNAALAGQGACLSWDGLLDEFLDSGSLLRLGDAQSTSDQGYFITIAADEPPGSEARAVAEWLAAATTTPTARLRALPASAPPPQEG